MLDAKICTAEQMNELGHVGTFYKRVPYVYAHGKLADDLGTDIVYLFKGDNNYCNGLRAYTQQGKPVRFHLYRHPRTFELVGIVTYSCEDQESYDYGKRLVEERPERF